MPCHQSRTHLQKLLKRHINRALKRQVHHPHLLPSRHLHLPHRPHLPPNLPRLRNPKTTNDWLRLFLSILRISS
uniref:ORF 73 n=1 Tax=Lactococcus phage mv4 TaxID=12392 RepID=Q9G0B9_BPMV4|nr:ORF 73 [Lactobacillus phage mv4]